MNEREEGTAVRSDGDETDEHIWLSLKNAGILTDKIAEALCAADGENAAVYRKNAGEYSKALKTLDEKYTDALKNAKQKALIFAPTVSRSGISPTITDWIITPPFPAVLPKPRRALKR